ncbi:MAG TPA: ABC transporter permease [Anaeromyxobacter sp.]|nr:ABC transporter permease [Anaeromyxobacter sp.]
MTEATLPMGREAGRAAGWAGRNWAVLFLALEFAAFTAFGTHFVSLENVQNVLVACTFVLLLGIGETFVIITGGIDLSVGFLMGFGTVTCAKAIVLLRTAGVPLLAAILLGALISLAVGLFPGLVNGLLVARLKVPPFLATFGMYGITYGAAEIICNNTQITAPEGTGYAGNEYLFYWVPGKVLSFVRPEGLSEADLRGMVTLVPIIAVITFLVAALFAFVLTRTRFGRHTYAIGGNMDAATRAGINVPRHLTYVYVISSAFAALAGVLFVLRYVTGTSDAGSSLMLDAVVAVVIGGASLYGGKGTVKGTIIGALIIAVLETGMVNLGIPTFNRYIAIGGILIFAVLIDQFFPDLVGRGK